MDNADTFGAGEVVATDPVLHEHLVQPWDLHHRVLKAGEFHYRIRYVKTPRVTVYWERFALACSLVGASPANSLVFCLPVRGRGRYWGASIEEDRIPVMSPGILDVELPTSCEQVLLLVDREHLLSLMEEEHRSRFQGLVAGHCVQATASSIARLQTRVCRFLRQCSRHNAATPAPVEQAETIVLDLIDALCLNNIAATPPTSQRRRGFERAMKILTQANPSELEVPELARVSGVSQRTLEYAFQDSLGMTPHAFLCRKRLHAARRDLWESGGDETTITEIALRNGFTHPSRFAQKYFQLFGEKPSDTMRLTSKTAVRRHSLLMH